MKTLYKLFILALFLPVAAAAQNTIPENNQRGDDKSHNIRAIVMPKDTVDKNGVKTAKQLKKEAADEKKAAAEKKPEDPVQTELISADKNAEFSDRAKFTFTVKNNTGGPIEGKVAYQVFTMTGEKLNKDSVKVKVGVKDKKGYDFEIPEAKPGFYKVNFTINVTDYDDTTRRAFGIRPTEIVSKHKKPADFDSFWKTTRAELNAVKPNFKTTLVKDSLGRHIYAIEMKSLDGLTIRGWMTVPKGHHRYPVWLGLPGYQVDLKPIITEDDELAIITLNVRGQGNSRDVIATPKDEYICYHIEDKDRYVMRGAIMDCIRCIDYIFTRKELDKKRIFVTGGSMGGYLTVATAALDDRVTICSAQNPIFSDVRQLVGEVEWPMSDLIKYTKTRPGLTVDKMLDNLDYFDIKNFAPRLNCPMLMAIGLLDPLAPPNNEYASYNIFPGDKKLMVYKDKAHEVGDNFGTMEAKWMAEAFALF
jgi:cephalosporin-C deacetylase-like acetyl esterase